MNLPTAQLNVVNFLSTFLSTSSSSSSPSSSSSSPSSSSSLSSSPSPSSSSSSLSSSPSSSSPSSSSLSSSPISSSPSSYSLSDPSTDTTSTTPPTSTSFLTSSFSASTSFSTVSLPRDLLSPKGLRIDGNIENARTHPIAVRFLEVPSSVENLPNGAAQKEEFVKNNVISVNSNNGIGSVTYRDWQDVRLAVTFSRPVTVTGRPRIILSLRNCTGDISYVTVLYNAKLSTNMDLIFTPYYTESLSYPGIVIMTVLSSGIDINGGSILPCNNFIPIPDNGILNIGQLVTNSYSQIANVLNTTPYVLAVRSPGYTVNVSTVEDSSIQNFIFLIEFSEDVQGQINENISLLNE